MSSLEIAAKNELKDQIQNITGDEPLDRKFIKWFCAEVLHIDEDDIEYVVTDGKNDREIDFYYHHESKIGRAHV